MYLQLLRDKDQFIMGDQNLIAIHDISFLVEQSSYFTKQTNGPHGTCFHVARVVSTPRNWKVFLMFCGNRMCPPGRVSTYSDVQGPANQQTSFSGRGGECVAHKLPFSGHIIKKFRGPSILLLNIKGLTASKMNVLHHLATQLEAFVKKAILRGRRNTYIPCWDAKCEALYQTFLQSPAGDQSSRAATALITWLDKKRRDR